MKLQIKSCDKASEYPHHRFDLYRGRKFIAYSQTKEGVEWAKERD